MTNLSYVEQNISTSIWRKIIFIRDGFKTQPPVDRRFRPVSIVLNNDNRPEPPVNRWLGFEAAPKQNVRTWSVVCVALAHHTVVHDWCNIFLETIPDPEWFGCSALCMIDSSQHFIVTE